MEKDGGWCESITIDGSMNQPGDMMEAKKVIKAAVVSGIFVDDKLSNIGLED